MIIVIIIIIILILIIFITIYLSGKSPLWPIVSTHCKRQSEITKMKADIDVWKIQKRQLEYAKSKSGGAKRASERYYPKAQQSCVPATAPRAKVRKPSIICLGVRSGGLLGGVWGVSWAVWRAKMAPSWVPRGRFLGSRNALGPS